MTRTLRPYQVEAVEAVRAAWAQGLNRPGIVLPTGTGKSSVIAKLATDEAEDGGRVLCLAHRGELLDQITATCKEFNPKIPIGRVQAGRNEGRRPITMAMTPTLANEARRARLRPPTMVIVDEAHHAASPSYMKILRWAGVFDHVPLLGVTATMVRGDKRGLGDVFQDVVFERSIQWAVEEGWLARPRGRAVVTDHMDLTTAKVSKGDYQDNELGEMVSQDAEQIVKAWHEHAIDRVTVAFAPTIESAQQLAYEFRAAGVPTGEVYGSTPKAEREEVIADLRAGRIRVLVNVMVATEGFDSPNISCVLVARPTRLPGLYTQMIGRGLRSHEGKTDCLVLDVVGTSRRQRLVTLIDLDSSVEYDTEELDVLPCEECGGAPRGQRLTEAAPFQCTCGTSPAERDPDGGRRRLIGPAAYEDIEDMFSSSKLNWLFTHDGLRFLPAGNRMAVLWPVDPEDDDTLWEPGHCTVKGRDREGRYVGLDGQRLAEPTSLGQARAIAEDWAIGYDPSTAKRASSWRKKSGPASEAQVRFATRLGVQDAEAMTKPQLSDEISIALASRVLG